MTYKLIRWEGSDFKIVPVVMVFIIFSLEVPRHPIPGTCLRVGQGS